MEATTAVTLLNGRVLELAGTYEDLRGYLTTGARREVTLADGRKEDLATNLVGLIEQGRERKALGFR